MDATGAFHPLPDARKADLSLAIPTAEECEAVNRLNFAAWGDSLTLQDYLEEWDYLADVPLAENNGRIPWILTDRNNTPNTRPVLASCETFRKRALITDRYGELSASIVYGIASVFVNPSHRCVGYGRRLLQELAKVFDSRHVGCLRPIGSILYSDIGKTYYTKLGWRDLPVNFHAEFDPIAGPLPSNISWITSEELPQLCLDDEMIVRKSMVKLPKGKTHMMIAPDIEHMLWHMSKESFSCSKIFGNIPLAKGAIAGEERGSRIWALWARWYYSHPNSHQRDNTLYILRFVIENQNPSHDELDVQARYVRGVLQAAQVEAAKWHLGCVKLWHPMPLMRKLLKRSGLDYREVEREKDSIASLRWFGDGSNDDESLEWVASEKYAWV